MITQAATAVALEVEMNPLHPPDDLRYGFLDPPPAAASTTLTGARGRPAGSNVRGRGGGWFADPAPGVDDHRRPVPCHSCGVALSQPRIDHGLTTCPNCHMSAQPNSGRRG